MDGDAHRDRLCPVPDPESTRYGADAALYQCHRRGDHGTVGCTGRGTGDQRASHGADGDQRIGIDGFRLRRIFGGLAVQERETSGLCGARRVDRHGNHRVTAVVSADAFRVRDGGDRAVYVCAEFHFGDDDRRTARALIHSLDETDAIFPRNDGGYIAMNQMLKKLRDRHPLAHGLVHDMVKAECANVSLALGASPMMAENPEEMRAIVQNADLVYANLGNQTRDRMDAIFLAREVAAKKGIPFTLDITGCGASESRRRQANELAAIAPIDIIKGNASEIVALAHGRDTSRGVDATATTGEALQESLQELVAKRCRIAIASGKTDWITDGRKLYRVFNGHPAMQQVTGTGCIGSALVGLFSAIDPLQGAVMGCLVNGIAGAQAIARCEKTGLGIGFYYSFFISRIDALTDEIIEKEGRWEVDDV